MTVVQRVIEYLKKKKISQADLSKTKIITSAGVNKVFLGETKNPGIKFFEAVAAVCPELNWNYAFTGEGPEENSDEVGLTPKLKEKIERYMEDRVELLEKLVKDKEEITRLQGELLKNEQLLRQRDGTIRQLTERLKNYKK